MSGDLAPLHFGGQTRTDINAQFHLSTLREQSHLHSQYFVEQIALWGRTRN